MSRKEYIERIELKDGDRGKITYGENGYVGVYWAIRPENINGTLYVYDGDLIKVTVKFIKRPKSLVVLETAIKPQFNEVKGIRQNISNYCVQIKKRYTRGFPHIVTRYNMQEDIKVNLCRHPSKNRSKHGAKTGVNRIYKAGGMSPK